MTNERPLPGPVPSFGGKGQVPSRNDVMARSSAILRRAESAVAPFRGSAKSVATVGRSSSR